MDLAWLFARPIAHRGLHDRTQAVVENSATAVSRAVERGFAIEVDVQISADGEAIVFHDGTLDRLTDEHGAVSAHSAAALRAMELTGSAAHDRLWTLPELLGLVDGRVPLVVEIKKQDTGGARLARRTAALLTAYRGPAAAKSFDPRIVAELRRAAPAFPRGIVGCGFPPDEPEWQTLSKAQRVVARNLLHWPLTRPHFLSWHVHALPSPATSAARAIAGVPIMTWTVRTPAEQAQAALYADQMVFEGFMP